MKGNNMANTLLDKLIKNSSVKLTDTLSNSKVYGKKDAAPTTHC